MHVHPSSPNSTSPISNSSIQSEESAAIKIQAGFRGYRVRKQVNPLNRCSMSQSNNKPSGNVSGAPHNARTGSADNSVEDRCATKIQAGVRGFLVRKKQKLASDAATKIQAGFRGFKARKEAQKLKQK